MHTSRHRFASRFLRRPAWGIVLLSLALALPGRAATMTETWTGSSNAVWSNSANWSGGTGAFPNSSTDVANFSSSSPLTSTITLGQNIALQELIYNRGSGHVGDVVTFDGGGGGGNSLTFTVTGSHIAAIDGEYSANLTFNADVNIGGSISGYIADVGSSSGSVTFKSGTTLTMQNAAVLETSSAGGVVNLNSNFNTGTAAAAVLIVAGGTVNWNVGTFTTSSSTADMIGVRGTSGTGTLNFLESFTPSGGGGIKMGLSSTASTTSALYGTANGITIGANITADASYTGTGATGVAGNIVTIGANNTSATSGSPTTVTFSGNVASSTSGLGHTLKLYAAANNTAQFTGVISGDLASSLYYVNGAGTVVLGGSSANTYNSGIAVEVGADGNGATLKLAKTSGVALTGNVKVDSGAKLLLAAANQTASATGVTLAGGTLDAGTFADTFGTLTLSSSSVLTLGSGAALVFSDSSALAWSGTLTVSGTVVNGSTLRFGTGSSGLTSTQLSDLVFSSYSGYTASLDSNGYLTLTAAPEPSPLALAGGAALLALAAWRRTKAASCPVA